MGPNAHSNGLLADSHLTLHHHHHHHHNNHQNTTNTNPQANNANGITNNTVKPFKQRRPFEARKLEVENIRKKFPSKIPVVVERYQREVNLPVMDKTKFLVPKELTMLNFAIIIKNRLRVPTSRAFYFVINNQSIASTSKTIAELYKEHKDEDGFLYMTYASQEMFGDDAKLMHEGEWRGIVSTL